jgi:cell division protein FtsQ
MDTNSGDIINGKEIAKSKAQERQQKLSEIRRKQRVRWLYVAVAVIAFFAVMFEVYHTSFLDVKTIEIRGNKYVSPETVKKACAINKPTNIFSVPVADIQSSISKNPWIKTVSVNRILPSTIRVDIVERAPIALISSAGRFFMVDEDRLIIASRAYSDGMDLPVIADLPVSNIKVGERLIHPSLENAIKCLVSMDPTFEKSINLVSASSVKKLSLYNKDNIEILYGDAKLAPEKNKVISGILKEQGKQVIFIDIRSYPQTDPVLRRLDAAP